ncbi:NAD(P)/FAD-dependent oxidoreductase [Desulforhopalus vacuolatus]|uniref:phytoene desaturase family protein n=1 Tax=Desulforhopalus vacuolatus TaxID=40414 RepID=UPI001965406B|nr:NAD(P)/FAD-dependent oxidoreductase [Desulforhopalus vacuolatus]MBM9519755.1 NAD(P)/FAD-dependent oxidoreductase [Desulforhopalus vacuolatus]
MVKADVVIIGSGISGLTAAALLAKHGKEVVLVEKNRNPGGSIRQFTRKNHAFDIGFHYTGCLGEGEILNLLWQHCGVLDKVNIIPASQGGYDHFEDPATGKVIRGYFSYEHLEEELIANFPHEKNGIKTYLKTIRTNCQDVPFYKTDLPLLPFLRGYKDQVNSLSSFLDKTIEDRLLRSVLEAPGFLYGVPTRKASVEVHSLVAHGYYSGAYKVAGGGQSVVNSFVDAIRATGTSLSVNAEVTSIQVKNGAVTGVTLYSGEEITCSQIIYTGHPGQSLALLPPSVFRPAYKSRVRNLQNSLSMFAVFAESEKFVDCTTGALNYYIFPKTGEILPPQSMLAPNQRIMLMTSGAPASSKELHGHGNDVTLLSTGYWKDVEPFLKNDSPRRSPEYTAWKADITDKMVTKAEERWGAISGTLTPLATATPLTFRDKLSAPSGCTYGAMHCLGQYTPDVRTRLSGFYLSGQSTLMTGVVGASVAGLVSAGEILGLEDLWRSIRL